MHWDPYPFILMNLFLSLQAAYTAPMLMMSQNRLAARDRLEAHNDFEINRKAEEEVRAVLEHLSAQDEALAKIVETLAAQSLDRERCRAMKQERPTRSVAGPPGPFSGCRARCGIPSRRTGCTRSSQSASSARRSSRGSGKTGVTPGSSVSSHLERERAGPSCVPVPLQVPVHVRAHPQLRPLAVEDARQIARRAEERLAVHRVPHESTPMGLARVPVPRGRVLLRSIRSVPAPERSTRASTA